MATALNFLKTQNSSFFVSYHRHPYQGENKAYRLFQGSTLLTTYTFLFSSTLISSKMQVGRKTYWHCQEGYLADSHGSPRVKAYGHPPSAVWEVVSGLTTDPSQSAPCALCGTTWLCPDHPLQLCCRRPWGNQWSMTRLPPPTAMQ